MGFLALSGINVEGTIFEIASRPRLDTRQVLPFFREGGALFVGVLERERAGRLLRGEAPLGWEAIGIDFGGVDETGDILSYGRAVFTAHAGVSIDEAGLPVPLPSHARSIGYLTELALPLLLPVRPPSAREISVAWDGETHTLRFLPLEEAVARIRSEEIRAAESLFLLLLGLSPPAAAPSTGPVVAASPGELRTADTLAARLSLCAWTDDEPAAAPPRQRPLSASDLRFLKLSTVPHGPASWELLTPASGICVAVLPYLETAEGKVYFLYEEPRPASTERALRAPLFDLPTSASFVNASAVFLSPAEDETRRRGGLPEIVEDVLSRGFPGAKALETTFVGPPLETCPGTSTELRIVAVVRLAEAPPLPAAAFAIHERELTRAVAEGLVHDPVVALALLSSGIDPFDRIRRGEAASRRLFLDVMTGGSVVQRRLRSYSSIETEQLGSATYARLMLLLQHRFGVRIAYPETEADRSFFKAAFRVFMAAGREEHRELQGLHWSHDAYHFALGNYTLVDSFDFERFYLGDEATPPLPSPDEEADYRRALKAAEDEATFFSFFTLFAEMPSLARHVGKLTFWQALVDLGLAEPLQARAIFDDLTVRAILPTVLSAHPAYAAREELRSLFSYMQGFRDYHFKDIDLALGFARKDAYRGFFRRFGLYERDADVYVQNVRSFPARLGRERPGLHPLLAALSDQKLSHALLVWDVTKALRLLRTATVNAPDRVARRTAFLQETAAFWERLSALALTEQHLREAIRGAELTAANEQLWQETGALGGTLAALHEAIWHWAGDQRLLSAEVVAKERARQLPR